MPEKAKMLAESLIEASRALPDAKKEFLFGYAEGVMAMVAKREEKIGVQPDNPELRPVI